MLETIELPAACTLRVASCLSVLIVSSTTGRRPRDPLVGLIPGDGPASPELRQVVSQATGREVPSHHDGMQTTLAYVRSALRRWGAAENARTAAI